MPPKVAKGKKNAYKVAPEFAPGEVLRDYTKKEWKLGKIIGTGGFGRIYCATSMSDSKLVGVIKIEPYENGPLFQETHVYQGVAPKLDVVNQWKREKRLSFLGVPYYIASGKHTYRNNDYRFLVIPKLGSDLETELVKHKFKLPPARICRIGINIVNAIEYMHSKRYIHADVKAENLLFGLNENTGTSTNLYLVDYGLARRLGSSIVHKRDPKAAHEGTLPFTCIDAHHGAKVTFRGDLEILGYNLLFWAAGKLPWWTPNKTESANTTVQAGKEKLKCDVKKKSGVVNEFADLPPILADMIQNFFKHVYTLDFDALPDYDMLRILLESAANELEKSQSPPTKQPVQNNKGKGKRVQSGKTDESGSEDVMRSHKKVPKVVESSAPRKRRSSSRSVKKIVKKRKVLLSSSSESSYKSDEDLFASEEESNGPSTSTAKPSKGRMTAGASKKTTKRTSPRKSINGKHTDVAGESSKKIPIPGLANMPNRQLPLATRTKPRKSIGADILKKYVKQSMSKPVDKRNGHRTTARTRGTAAANAYISISDATCQTSPNLWTAKTRIS